MLVYVSLIALTMIAALRLMGRPWHCKCGRLDLWATGASHYSHHLFDPWTVTHIGHGIFFYGCFRGFLVDHQYTVAIVATIALEAAWEVLENTHWVIEAYRRSGDEAYIGDSVVNSLGDLLACFVGALGTSWFV